MELIDLNRDGGIGANSLHLRLGEFRLLIDCGLHPKKVGRIAAPDLAPLRGQPLDLIVVTHCHLDHIGSLPVAMREHPETPVVMSVPSRTLIERMLHNSAKVMLRQKEEEHIPDYPLFTHKEIDRCAPRMVGLPFGHAKTVRGRRDQIDLILHPAGHVAGAAGVELRHSERSVFITGDVMFGDQRTLTGAKFPARTFDTLITETTRGDAAHVPNRSRASEIARLLTAMSETIEAGGSYLLPVFALGRMQELIAVLHDARRAGRLKGFPIYASGLGMDLADYFDDISRQTPTVKFSRSMVKDLQVRPLPRRLKPGKAPARNCLYLVSSGMMVENTPSYLLATGLIGEERNALGFVGYCDPDTPGGKLLAARPGENFLFEAAHVSAPIAARIDRFALSGHASREELIGFAVQTAARQIVLTHGDPPARAWFAQELARVQPMAALLDPVPLRKYSL